MNDIETDEEAFDRIYHLIYNILKFEERRMYSSKLL